MRNLFPNLTLNGSGGVLVISGLGSHFRFVDHLANVEAHLHLDVLLLLNKN